MADVTDAAFRRIIAKCGKPDVMWTEFVSVDGLCSVGRKKLLPDLWYTEAERPIVAQIFGCNPENFYKTALLIQELEFDGIDINMGCPMKNIEHQHAGATLMKDSQLALKIVRETKRGAGKLPVSVKTRLGYSKIDLDWIRAILETEPAALTVHLRTRKEMSKVPAHWDVVPEIVSLNATLFGAAKRRPIILGNGDVRDVIDAQKKVAEYGCDGVMIGRGIFGNPWLFAGADVSGTPLSLPLYAQTLQGHVTHVPDGYTRISLNERLRVMLEHTYLFEELFAGIKNFDIMKKHYKAYVNGFDGAKELRVRLMTCKTAQEVEVTVRDAFPAVGPVLRQ